MIFISHPFQLVASRSKSSPYKIKDNLNPDLKFEWGFQILIATEIKFHDERSVKKPWLREFEIHSLTLLIIELERYICMVNFIFH